MRDIELTLISFSYEQDKIGQEQKEEIKIPIPIMKQTSIMFEEFYEANKQGIKPTSQFIISALNYNGQTELEYMSERYSIIRIKSTNPDELSLICEKRVGNVN